MFGGRVLLPYELYLQRRRIYFGQESVGRPEEGEDSNETKEHYHMKSFLDVIADSGTVEAYLITRQEMQYLSEHFLTQIYDSIVQIKEPDRPSKEEIILEKREALIRERNDKVKMVKGIIKQAKIEKFGVMAVKDNP